MALIVFSPSTVIKSADVNANFAGLANGSLFTGAAFAAASGAFPQGTLINGKIVPSVTSNNLTVAIKAMDGTDPTTANPVYVRIDSAVRAITAALSVSAAAGTNWGNAGGAELATNEVDYFVYLGYNATDGVTLGFSRIPFARTYSDFSATSTNEKFAKISTITNAASTDEYNVVGRFAATLSAGAGYTWTVPAFTPINLIQRPIFETRWLNFVPVFTGWSTSGPTGGTKIYQIVGNQLFFTMHSMSQATGNSTSTTITVPLAPVNNNENGGMMFVNDNATFKTGYIQITAGSNTQSIFTGFFQTGWVAAGNRNLFMPILNYQI